MNTLVLIGLALVVAGFVLLALRFAPRVRRQFATAAAQPRTVADLVRLRQEAAGTGARPVLPAAAPAVPRRVAAAPPVARPEPPAPRVAPVPAPEPAVAQAPPAPEPPAPAFVAPPPRPTPVAGRVRRESAEPPAASLDGDNSPWQRGARMAVGLGGGQPWREPPAPPTPLRIVPAAEPPAPVEPDAAAPAPVRLVPAEPEPRSEVAEEPVDAPAPAVEPPAPVEAAAPVEAPATEPAVPVESDVAAAPVPVRLVAAEPEPRSEVAEEPVDAPAPAVEPAPVEAAAPAVPVEPVAPAPVRLVPSEPEPRAQAAQAPDVPVPDVVAEQAPVRLVPAEPAINRQAVWIEPGAAAAQEEASPEPEDGVQATTGILAAAQEPAEGRSVETSEGEIPIPGGWDDVEAEDVPAAAVPDRFAEEQPPAPAEPAARRRNRQSPDERAAEQAAADLALLRTFGFADPGLRPDSAPVVEMEHPEEPEAPIESGAAQPVRYRVIRRDGSVVGGATVTLLDDRGGDVAAGAADAEGRGQVLAPSPGGYVLVSTAAGHQPGAVAITVAGSAAETDVLIARSASVAGSVRGEDGPIAGARVTLVQDGEAVDAVDTDADGTYRIGDIGAGEYGLSVAAPGCEPVATLLEVAEEADVRHDVELRPASPVADSDLVDDDAMSGLR